MKAAFVNLGFGGQNKFVYQILAELDDDQSGGIDFAEFLRLATAKISDKDSRAEIDKVFTSFDINRAVKMILNCLGKNNNFGIEKSGSRFRRGFNWLINLKDVCQGRSWWRWICDCWWFLQHNDSQSLLGSMIMLISTLYFPVFLLWHVKYKLLFLFLFNFLFKLK